MTHQQLTDKLADKHLVQAIDEDLSRLVFQAMAIAKNEAGLDQKVYVLSRIYKRWNCVITANHYEITEAYKQKTILVLTIQLHKYGFTDNELTGKAIGAVDYLNHEPILSDNFFRKSAEIKEFLRTEPILLKRKPVLPESITFYRPNDVISIQLDKFFYAAYIHKLTGPNESPIIEFYDKVFEKVPTLNELATVNAKGRFYNESKIDRAWFGIDGLKNLPDPANQIQLIGACVEQKPDNTRLHKPVGLYQMSDLFTLQREISILFGPESDQTCY